MSQKRRQQMEQSIKGRVCVTGGAGFLGSWLVKRLLEEGYSVNATARLDPEKERDLSYLTNLPGASERLRIFNADLKFPDTFIPAIEGCVGVFHTANPLDLENKETEQVKIKQATSAIRGILQACVDSKTVRRVVFTSSLSTHVFSDLYGSSSIDENSLSDVETVRRESKLLESYTMTKISAETTAFDVAQELGVDLVSIAPTWVSGPFICNHFPDTVQASVSLIKGTDAHYPFMKDSSMVHVDDVARAHIHLFEYPKAKGRYLNVAVDFSLEKMHEVISKLYPEYQLPNAECWKDVVPVKSSGVSNKKLLETGFKYEYGVEEIIEGAISTCKQKGFL